MTSANGATGTGGAPWQTRLAQSSDLEAVSNLLVAAHLPTDGLQEQFGEAYVVAECEGAVIGVAGLEVYGVTGLLRSATVDERWRGAGVGEALTRDRLAWARVRGLEAVWLLTTTAAEYFPRFGFEVADRADAPHLLRQSREFVDACPASAVAMRLALEGRIGE